jgi:hypothetical protein
MNKIEAIYIKHKKKQKKIAAFNCICEQMSEASEVIKNSTSPAMSLSLYFLCEKYKVKMNLILHQPIILPKDRKKGFVVNLNIKEDDNE